MKGIFNLISPHLKTEIHFSELYQEISAHILRLFNSITIRLNIILLLFYLLIGFSLIGNSFAKDTVRIGILKITRIDGECQKWEPTVNYLSDRIEGKVFVIVPLKFEEIDPAIKNRDVDFIFLNSSMYVRFEKFYGISRIATLKNRGLCDSSYSSYAGIIFCRYDRVDINELTDLEGKTFAAVDRESFGGFQMAWRELENRGINPFDDFKALKFMGTHDEVVLNVLDGLSDAGTVRADIFSNLSKMGVFDSSQIKVLNLQSREKTNLYFRCSTRPYPEWPMAKLNHVSQDLAEKVALRLLEMSPSSEAALAAGYAGWTIPYNYQSVHDCLIEIKVPPYENFGKFSLTDVLIRYWVWIVIATIVFVFLIFSSIKIKRLNKTLSQTRAELENALNESNLFNKVLFDLSQIPIVIINPENSMCLYCNDAYLLYLGFNKKEEILNHSFLDCSADFYGENISSSQVFKEKIDVALKQGSVLFDWKGKKINGELWDAVIHMASFKYQGKTLLQCSIMDITEQKIKEKKLRESKKQLDEAQRIAHIGSWILDITTNKLIWSDEIYRIFEIDPENFGASYEAFLNLIHPDDKEKVNKAYRDSLEKQEPYKVIHRIKLKDGRIKWVEENCETYYDDQKNALRSVGTVQDITEQVETAQKLKEAHQLLETVFDNTHIMIAYLDNQFRFIRVNNAYASVENKEPSYFKGKDHFDLYPNDENKRIFQKVVETGEPYFVFAKPFKYAYSQERNITYWDWSLIPIKSSEGKVDGLILSLLNVTERVLAETALRQSELKYKNIIDYSPIGIYQSGLNGEVLLANDRFAKILGYDSPDEVMKLNFTKDIYVNPKIREMLIDQTKKGKMRYELELYWKKKNGKKIWVRNTVRVNRDTEGNIQTFEGFIQDISLWKKYETELIKLSKAVEQSSAAIVITDTNGNIEYVNKSFTTITGYTFDEAINKNPRILKSGKQNNEFYKNLWETILSRKNWRGELQNKRKNGEMYWESSIITPITNEKGEIINFVAIKEDISEKKKMIKDLIEAKEKAEEMNRIKTVFFANMSHELRTPFVGIMGYAELLSETLTDPEAKEMADGILNTSIRLTDTLTKILDITRLEYKKIEANRDLVNIKSVINEIYMRYKKPAERKNLSFSKLINVDNNFISTDENLLAGILNNLVSNAIKYTDEGTVKIDVYKEITNSKYKLIIRVSDTGIGIEEEKKEIIWEEFRQVSEGTTRNYQGCGLGLSIAKKYTELIGGNIYLESKYGAGSTFFLEIPLD